MPEPITRTFINSGNTLLVTLWPNGKLDVQTRLRPHMEWGMPVRCQEELQEEKEANHADNH